MATQAEKISRASGGARTAANKRRGAADFFKNGNISPRTSGYKQNNIQSLSGALNALVLFYNSAGSSGPRAWYLPIYIQSKKRKGGTRADGGAGGGVVAARTERKGAFIPNEEERIGVIFLLFSFEQLIPQRKITRNV